MKRTPLTRRKPLERRTPLRPVSEKTKAKREELGPLRQEYKRLVGRCECCDAAKKPEELDVHEITAGSSRQRAFGQPLLWCCVCRDCHRWIQGRPFADQLTVKTGAVRRAINRALGREEL